MTDDNNEQQKYLAEFNAYFPESDRESGVIKEIREDLERIKKISDSKEQSKEAASVSMKHIGLKANSSKCYINGRLKEKGISEFDTLHIYDKLIRELGEFHHKLVLENIKKQREQEKPKSCHCSHCHQEIELKDALIICQKKECQEKLCPKNTEKELKADTNQIKSNQIKWMVGF